MYVVKLRADLEGLGKAGDLVVAETAREPKNGEFVVAELDGRRVVSAWRPGVPWLATVVHVFS